MDTVRSVLKRVCGIVLHRVAVLFFEEKYLNGRYFDRTLTGYKWCLRSIWSKNILRLSRPLPWPTVLTCRVSNPSNLIFDPNDLNNFQSGGTYFQNFNARIVIGKGTYIAPNVGIITSNHVPGDLDVHSDGRDVVIGCGCWIGFGAVVLPGVKLGDGTIVAAGSVVTKSFDEDRIVLAGVPAKIIKKY